MLSQSTILTTNTTKGPSQKPVPFVDQCKLISPIYTLKSFLSIASTYFSNTNFTIQTIPKEDLSVSNLLTMTPSIDTNGSTTVESRKLAESLIPLFRLTRILNQDSGGRRVLILGNINNQNGILSLERAAFPSSSDSITSFLSTLTNTTNLGANDIYRWYLSNNSSTDAPDLKINLIWPCTDVHVRKYTVQQTRYVTETSDTYIKYIKPWIERTQRTPKRLEWIWNILDGIKEQEDIVYRSASFSNHHEHSGTTKTNEGASEGFLLLPDLNWDRRTVASLHLLAIVERRDIWSLRDLRKKHVPWLKQMRAEIVKAAAEQSTELAKKAKEESTRKDHDTLNDADDSVQVQDKDVLEEMSAEDIVEEDQIKCYIHYHPTYYHFHVHVVHVMLEAEGHTQSTGKAFNFDNLISQLECMDKDENSGMEDVEISYFMGEQSELWRKLFYKLKMGEEVDLNQD